MNMSGRWHTWQDRCRMGSTSRVNVGCSGTAPSFAAAAAGLSAANASSTMAGTRIFDNDMFDVSSRQRPARLPGAPDAGR